MANRLAGSISPYLLQHADNPVDWWPWSDAAFADAIRRDVPVFLSIGYAACHWCHVMAHESFEDEDIARYLNDNFVPIKVDREERPDVDSLYMQATTMLTGHGGWPMSVFLDPDGRPFHAGTYFGREPGPAGPSFRQVLQSVNGIWHSDRDRVTEAAIQLTEAVRQSQSGPAESGAGLEIDPDNQHGELTKLADDAAEQWLATWDRVHGGFGSAPKFPPAMTIEFLLRHHARTGSDEALAAVAHTCQAMAGGGIYDQIGGGFARYSVEETWHVPHFEKMLYDNALLTSAYLHWWRAGGGPLGERVVRETISFLLTEMRTRHGAFAASLDADSPPTVPEQDAEGAYYTWCYRQLTEILGRQDGEWAANLLGITRSGSFARGYSLPTMRQEPDDLERWLPIRQQLAAIRSDRGRPPRDDKVIAAWNGMTIRALAEAGLLLDEPEWIAAAAGAAQYLITTHLRGSGPDTTLARTSRDGVPGPSLGVAEDYATLAHGLLVLSEVTSDQRWLNHALDLLDTLLAHFTDADGTLFDTDARSDSLLHRPRDIGDNAVPSGTTSALAAFQTSAALTGDAEHRAAVDGILAGIMPALATHPRHLPWGLAGLEAAIAGPVQVAVVSSGSATPGAALEVNSAIAADAESDTRQMLRAALLGTSAGLVAFAGTSGNQSLQLLAGRTSLDGRPTAYVCRGFTCQAPTTEIDLMAQQVGAHQQHSRR